MVKVSKFKVGDEVKSILNLHETYKILEVLRNELKVVSIDNKTKFSCKKSLFEVIEDGNL